MDAYIALALAVGKPLLISTVVTGALVGLLAVISPQAFVKIVAIGDHWVDTHKFFRTPDNKFFRFLDTWVETGPSSLRSARLTGMLMLVGAAFLGVLHFSS